jgi:hypothetical protein
MGRIEQKVAKIAKDVGGAFAAYGERTVMAVPSMRDVFWGREAKP